jgi:hypothetical protein
MDWQARNEQGLPQVQEGALQLDPNDPRGASGSATGGPNSIERIRGSQFRNFIPPLQQQQIATKFMQERGIPLNEQNRQQVMQFLMGADAQPAAAPVNAAAEISAGIDAADGAGGVPGAPPTATAPAAPTQPQGGPGWNPLWLLVPAIGKKVVDAQKTGTPTTDLVPADGTPFKAGDALVPFTFNGEALDPETDVRINGDQLEFNNTIDGTWSVVDEPDDATVQQLISQTYGADVGGAGAPPMANDVPPQLPGGGGGVPALPAPESAPISTEDIMSSVPEAPTVEIGEDAVVSEEAPAASGTDARKAASEARRKAAKEERKKSGIGRAARTVRGGKR